MSEITNYNDEVLNFEKDIYSLALHEQTSTPMCWGTRIIVTRVPGGWLYQYITRVNNWPKEGADIINAPVFVPYAEI